MNTETIVAVYDTAAHAEAAVADLKAANVPADAIAVHASTATDAGSTAATAPRDQGFWSNLFGGQPDHDTSVYERSLSSGSTVVTVNAPEEHVESVSSILESHNPVDLNDRAASYGTSAATTTTTTKTLDTAVAPMPQAATRATADDGVIALSEEELVVGKRLVDRGTTRVRRFVVEKPVEADVSLRSEHVSIERRPVTGNIPVDAAAFTDREISVTETAEEAVVGKTVHVAEEVVVKKQAEERVETIHDTVRREDVEITKDAATTVNTTGSTTIPVAPMSRPKI